jgi:hypothetical protein
MNSTPRICAADTLWRGVRADVLERLVEAYPLLDHDQRVLVAEYAAREVQDVAKAVAADAARTHE